MTELPPDQHEAIAHWSTFGRPGQPQQTRYVPDAAIRGVLKGFVAPESGVWRVTFDRVQTDVLLRGFRAEEMEDKWIVYSDDPSESGATSVHLHRSWTGAKIIQVDLELTPEGSRCVGATWEMDPGILKGASEDFAWSTFVEVCRWVLRMEPGA